MVSELLDEIDGTAVGHQLQSQHYWNPLQSANESREASTWLLENGGEAPTLGLLEPLLICACSERL